MNHVQPMPFIFKIEGIGKIYKKVHPSKSDMHDYSNGLCTCQYNAMGVCSLHFGGCGQEAQKKLTLKLS